MPGTVQPPEPDAPAKHHHHRPVHPDTRPLAKWIEAIARWYTQSFGTPAAFAVSVALLIAWIALIPIMGYAKWNIGPGLLGNTIESTGEWFFEVAILIVAAATAVRTKGIESDQLHQRDRETELLTANTALLQQNTDLTQQVHDMTTTQGQLLGQVHALMAQITAAPAPGGAHATDTEAVRAQNAAAEVRTAQATRPKRGNGGTKGDGTRM